MVSKTQPVNAALPAVFHVMRFRLQKDGPLQYISHLDFVRTMTKILVRSKLPLWYTQGFNPIPKITFAAPLSVGMESDCELMDVRLCEEVEPSKAKEQLSRVLPPHLVALDAYTPKSKLSEIGFLCYDIRMTYDGICQAHAEEANAFLASPSIIIQKKGKSGVRDLDLRPMMHKTTLTYCAERQEIVGEWILSAAPEAFLNPELLVTTLREHTPLLPKDRDVWYGLRRREVLSPDLSIFH